MPKYFAVPMITFTDITTKLYQLEYFAKLCTASFQLENYTVSLEGMIVHKHHYLHTTVCKVISNRQKLLCLCGLFILLL